LTWNVAHLVRKAVGWETITRGTVVLGGKSKSGRTYILPY
jgi:hypothetical protein